MTDTLLASSSFNLFITVEIRPLRGGGIKLDSSGNTHANYTRIGIFKFFALIKYSSVLTIIKIIKLTTATYLNIAR